MWPAFGPARNSLLEIFPCLFVSTRTIFDLYASASAPSWVPELFLSTVLNFTSVAGSPDCVDVDGDGCVCASAPGETPTAATTAIMTSLCDDAGDYDGCTDDQRPVRVVHRILSRLRLTDATPRPCGGHALVQATCTHGLAKRMHGWRGCLALRAANLKCSR
jgi:hypothetical protein